MRATKIVATLGPASSSAEVLKKFIQDIGFDCQDVWVIGDSLKSDINPGIEIGGCV